MYSEWGFSAPVDRAREVAVGAVATDFFMIRIERDAYGATYTTTCRSCGYLRVSLARHKCKVKKHQGPYRCSNVIIAWVPWTEQGDRLVHRLPSECCHRGRNTKLNDINACVVQRPAVPPEVLWL